MSSSFSLNTQQTLITTTAGIKKEIKRKEINTVVIMILLRQERVLNIQLNCHENQYEFRLLSNGWDTEIPSHRDYIIMAVFNNETQLYPDYLYIHHKFKGYCLQI